MQVAQTILAQLGGRKFIAMTGSKDFIGSDTKLQFKVGKNPNKVTNYRITLDPSDTYTVESLKWNGRKLDMQTVSSHSDVYCDMLQSVFTDDTGLFTRL